MLAWLRLQRDDPPGEEEMKFNRDRMEMIKARRGPKVDKGPYLNPGSSFPRYDEYEDMPGVKYGEGK